MPGNNLTDIEKQFIDQQVDEWKKVIYAQRAIGIDVDTLNTKLAVRHDNGEIWEILIKCKRIAEPVKSGPAGLTTWEKTGEVIPKGMETIDLSGQLPDPSLLSPSSPYAPEKVAADMRLLPGKQINIGAMVAEALNRRSLETMTPMNEFMPGHASLHCRRLDIPIQVDHENYCPMDVVDPRIKPGSTHERWHRKGLEKCPVSMDDIMNLQQGLEAAGPFFKLMDDPASGKHTHQATRPWWHDAGYGEM